MQAAITGASGFLGKHLLDELINYYDKVIAIVREPTKLDHIQNEKLVIIKGDITDSSSLKKPFTGVDHLYHTAAKVGSEDRDTIFLTNVEGTYNVLTVAQEQGVKRVIFTSSFFALGETNSSSDPVMEDWDVLPTFKFSYIQSKYESGKLVDEYARNNDLDIVTVCPTFMVGLGMINPTNAFSISLLEYLNGKLPGIPGGGNNIFNFVLASSVAKGHIQAALKGKKGEKYILGGENLPLKVFYGMFGEKIGRNPPRGLPKILGIIYSRLLGLSKLIGKKPKLTRADIIVSTKSYAYKSDKAITELGYKITPVETIIRPMFEYLLDSGYLNRKTGKKVKGYLFT
ncbi:MAG: NAD-dependent epimerase/dehydratase family protein [Candidatus Hodarchaeales archaeon]|jgi:nucleoside-diphosphate-sugar epimerase